jgi:hypothetical protein
MILLLLLKKNFSLIEMRFYYFRVVKYMLDISRLKITNSSIPYYAIETYSSTVVKLRSMYQTKVL